MLLTLLIRAQVPCSGFSGAFDHVVQRRPVNATSTELERKLQNSNMDLVVKIIVPTAVSKVKNEVE